MSQNLVAVVESQIDLGAGQHLIRLAAPEIAASAKPGEFVMLGLPDIDRMLIRRPFSIARVDPDPAVSEPRSIEILYKVFGARTAAFAGLRPGSELSVLGPLGRGYWLPDPGDPVRVVLVAGGIGNAIFPLAVQYLGPRALRATMIFGARTADDLSLLDWFRERMLRVVTVTEDGSSGARGLVTAPLADEIARAEGAPMLILACGPTPMLRAVGALAIAHDVPCQLALEETMACGFGVCLGCVVEKRHPESDFDRYVRVCTEGPVFDAREVIP